LEIVEQLIEEYGDRIRECVYRGFHSWYEDHHPGVILLLKARTRASYVCDRIYEALREKLEASEDFRFIEKGNARFLLFRQYLLIRLKKLNKNLKPSQILTPSASAFLHQQDPWGFGDFTNVFLGYTLTEGSEVDRILVIKTDQSGRFEEPWDIGVDHATENRELEFPATIVPDFERAGRRRFRARAQSEDGTVSQASE